MSLPCVSVIIPYNKDRGFLKEAIESVHAQRFDRGIELLLSHSPGTVGFNINQGVKKARGSFIKYFAEDDLLDPDCLEKSINHMFINNTRWIHGNAINFFPTIKQEHLYKPFYKIPTFEQMLDRNHIHGGTVMFESTLLKQFPFDESLQTGEEYDLYLRLYKAGILPGYMNETVFRHRRWEGQKSLGNTNREYQQWRSRVIKQIQNKHRV